MFRFRVLVHVPSLAFLIDCCIIPYPVYALGVSSSRARRRLVRLVKNDRLVHLMLVSGKDDARRRMYG